MKDDPLYLINVDNSIDGWWPSDTRVQDIWSQSTDLDCLKYSSFSTWSVNISWWRHQMETFSALLALCAENSPVPGEFPTHKGQWRGALMFTLTWARIKGWVNNGEPGDFRRYRGHYDVTVMFNFLQHCECQVWSKVYLCQCCTILPSYNTGPWTPLVKYM